MFELRHIAKVCDAMAEELAVTAIQRGVISRKYAAEALGSHQVTVGRWVKEGKAPNMDVLKESIYTFEYDNILTAEPEDPEDSFATPDTVIMDDERGKEPPPPVDRKE